MMMNQSKRNQAFWVRKKFERRRFLTGSVSGIPIMLGLPIFDQYLNDSGTAFAAGDNLPIRFGTFFWGLGWGPGGHKDDPQRHWNVNFAYWNPSGKGAGNAWTLGEAQSSLAPHKDYVTVFSNYSYKTPQGAGHIPQRGLGVSASHNPEWVSSTVDGFRRQNMPHPSVDAAVSEAWGSSGGVIEPYINMTCAPQGTLYKGVQSWNKNGGSRSFYDQPNKLFDSVFAPLKGDATPQVETPLSIATKNYQKSVLDGLKNELATLKNQLSSKDQKRLDSHLQAVRDLESKLAALEENTDYRDLSNLARPANISSNTEVQKAADAMGLLLQYALATNITRVFCFEFTQTQCQITIPSQGLDKGIHDGYSHGNHNMMKVYLKFCMDNLATLVGKLKSVSEGSGNLLDNTLMVCTSEYGHAHANTCHPYLFIGKAGGALKGNYNMDRGDRNNNEASKVLLSAVRAVGINKESFGMPATPKTGAAGGPAQTANYRSTEHIQEVFNPGFPKLV